MALQTSQEVRVDDVQRKLAEALGPNYRVTVASDSTLKVGRTGVIPAHVKLTHTDGGTTFKLQTTGLILSRLAQVTSIYPSVRRALVEAYPSTPTRND